MNKTIIVLSLIIAVLSGVLIYLVYGVGKNYSRQQEALNREIEVLNERLKGHDVERLQLKAKLAKKNDEVEAVKIRLESTSIDLTKRKKALNYYAKEFKKLTDRDRDSIINAYIRANQ